MAGLQASDLIYDRGDPEVYVRAAANRIVPRFESRFECGNLQQVYMVSEIEVLDESNERQSGPKAVFGGGR